MDVLHQFVEEHASRRSSHPKDVPGTLGFLLERRIEVFECDSPIQKGFKQLCHFLLRLETPQIKSLMRYNSRGISEILLLCDSPLFYQIR